MTCRAAGLRPREKQNRGRTVFWVNGLMRERPLGIKLRQESAQLLICRPGIKFDFIFRKRGNHTVARKHRRPLYHCRWTDAVDSHLRRK